jgi:hypothetical protein
LTQRLGTIAIVAFSLLLFLPLSTTVPELEPDLSFRVVNHHSFLERLQAGREIVSTFGPWGFLFRGYHPGTNALLFILNALLGSVFGWGLVEFWRAAPSRMRPLFVFGAIAVLIPAGPDARYFALLSLIVVRGHFPPPEYRAPLQKPSHLHAFAIGVAAALVALIKFSYFALASGLIVIAGMEYFRKHRRISPMLVAFAGGILLWWLAAGQNPLNLPVWFIRSLDMASGYSAGGSLPPPSGIRFDLLFAGSAAAMVILVGLSSRAILPTLSCGVFLFFLFKASYVRYDDMHALTAMAAIGSFALLILPREFGERYRSVTPVLAAAAAGAILLGLPYGIERVRSMASAISSGRLEGAYESWLAHARASTPMARVNGSVDSYHHGQAAVIAHGLAYSGRPVFQSYLAWTPGLARLNADHLRGPDAPRFAHVEFQPVDEHLPMMEDGPSWIELIRLYRRREGRMMERRTEPLVLDRRDLGAHTLGAGDRLRFPAARGALVAEVRVKQPLLERLRGVIYRGGIQTLSVTFPGGSVQKFRLSPAAEAGFILSPQMTDLQFLDWSTAPALPPGVRPEAVSVDAPCEIRLVDATFRTTRPPPARANLK